MAEIRIDWNAARGNIKPMHGVGQPPLLGTSTKLFQYLKEAGVPYSRLHDVGGRYGAYVFVDIPNIFRDFDADPTLPESYDFAFTDLLLAALDEYGVEPYYRLGVTIENYPSVRRYFTVPPKDNLKWAQICEHIIRHYTEGWAGGYHYRIRYWEIWNEPENHLNPDKNQMWSGTAEEYYDLYVTASKYLKARFPHLKFGGYAACGFYYLMRTSEAPFNAHPYDSPTAEWRMRYFEDFLRTLKEHGAPLDFFSWHSYDDHPAYNALYADYVRKTLDRMGFGETESSLNEWNAKCTLRGTAEHAATTAATLIALQQSPLDNAMFYDARCGASTYSGMFNPDTYKPYPAYYAFFDFNLLYRLGTEACALSDTEGVWVCAARDDHKGCVMVVNDTEKALPLSIRADGAVFDAGTVTKEECVHEECGVPELLPARSFVTLRYTLA